MTIDPLFHESMLYAGVQFTFILTRIFIRKPSKASDIKISNGSFGTVVMKKNYLKLNFRPDACSRKSKLGYILIKPSNVCLIYKQLLKVCVSDNNIE